MKKLIKPYVSYGIVIAVIYLGMPFFFQGANYKYDAIEYQFVFPAKALLSGFLFAWRRGMDFTFPLIAPIIYIGSVLIHSHYYHWAIYVFIYLIVDMLGCFIGDMIYKSDQAAKNPPPSRRDRHDPYSIKITGITVEKEEEENNN